MPHGNLQSGKVACGTTLTPSQEAHCVWFGYLSVSFRRYTHTHTHIHTWYPYPCTHAVTAVKGLIANMMTVDFELRFLLTPNMTEIGQFITEDIVV